jgi:hypothetical protein
MLLELSKYCIAACRETRLLNSEQQARTSLFALLLCSRTLRERKVSNPSSDSYHQIKPYSTAQTAWMMGSFVNISLSIRLNTVVPMFNRSILMNYWNLDLLVHISFIQLV